MLLNLVPKLNFIWIVSWSWSDHNILLLLYVAEKVLLLLVISLTDIGWYLFCAYWTQRRYECISVNVTLLWSVTIVSLCGDMWRKICVLYLFTHSICGVKIKSFIVTPNLYVSKFCKESKSEKWLGSYTWCYRVNKNSWVFRIHVISIVNGCHILLCPFEVCIPPSMRIRNEVTNEGQCVHRIIFHKQESDICPSSEAWLTFVYAPLISAVTWFLIGRAIPACLHFRGWQILYIDQNFIEVCY